MRCDVVSVSMRDQGGALSRSLTCVTPAVSIPPTSTMNVEALAHFSEPYTTFSTSYSPGGGGGEGKGRGARRR